MTAVGRKHEFLAAKRTTPNKKVDLQALTWQLPECALHGLRGTRIIVQCHFIYDIIQLNFYAFKFIFCAVKIKLGA